MTAFKSGDLVVLKSGGPIMTVDTVNTDIFDDDKMTGVLCVWFVGDKLQRVRFDHRAITPVEQQAISAGVSANAAGVETASDYMVVLDSMVGAMNMPPDVEETAKTAPKRHRAAARISEKTH